MKKILTFTALLTLVALLVQAQPCTPDTSFTSPGIYPDSLTGIDTGYTGMPYNQVITVIIPVDTIVDIGSGPVLAMIDSVKLIKLTNLPGWAVISCDPPTCAFPGGETHCATISGTPNQTDTVVMDIIVLYYINISGFPFQQYDTIYGYYTLVVDQGSGIGHVPSAYRAGVPVPNPAGDVSYLEIQSKIPAQVTLRLVDITGREVRADAYSLKGGTNTIAIDTKNLYRGMYFLILERSGYDPVVRKLIKE